MITIVAEGFLAENPAVELIGQSRKCEITVLWARSARKGSEWVTVWERAIFVAWDDEAERLASMLEKGSDVACTGVQETSTWIDRTGATRYSTRYRLTYWLKKHRAQSTRNQQDADPREGRGHGAERTPYGGQQQRQHGPARASNPHEPRGAPSVDGRDADHGGYVESSDGNPEYGSSATREFL